MKRFITKENKYIAKQMIALLMSNYSIHYLFVITKTDLYSLPRD